MASTQRIAKPKWERFFNLHKKTPTTKYATTNKYKNGMTYKRKKYHYGDTKEKRKWRTRNRKKDLDEINEDIKPKNCEKLLNQELDVDKPGCGQFYCVHCARYFVDSTALNEHFRSKGHKRRLKDLEDEPYTIEESERAAGKGSYVEFKKRKIETQPIKEIKTL